MGIIFLTNSISPHQLPFCAELAKRFCHGAMAYLYTEPMSEGRIKLGWCASVGDFGLKIEYWPSEHNSGDVENCDLLIADIRDIAIFNKRAKRAARTFYISERWFKPPFGILRLLHPKYLMMAYRLVRLLKSSPGFLYLPQGIHAARDMARLCGLLAGDLRCLFRAPKLDFEKCPGGRIWLAQGREDPKAQRKYCLGKMRMWGYFVEPSKYPCQRSQSEDSNNNSKLATPNSPTKLTQSQLTTHNCLRVLWVGRLLKLKRVDTIIRAVGEIAKSQSPSNSNSNSNFHIQLDIYGTGTEETKLKKLAAKYGEAIKFYPPVPIDEVRKLMHNHDVYVLSSNAYEGWGAVVSEALEEGMKVLGTYEAGSSATILPDCNLFHAGNWRELLELLQANIKTIGIGEWTASNAAQVFANAIVKNEC